MYLDVFEVSIFSNQQLRYWNQLWRYIAAFLWRFFLTADNNYSQIERLTHSHHHNFPHLTTPAVGCNIMSLHNIMDQLSRACAHARDFPHRNISGPRDYNINEKP